jgi:hypothetical protein
MLARSDLESSDLLLGKSERCGWIDSHEGKLITSDISEISYMEVPA